MPILRVVVDQLLADSRHGVGRYSEELSRALIDTAPAGCHVAAIVAARSKDAYEHLADTLPGLVELERVPPRRTDIARALPLGLTVPQGTSMVHAPSLLAPLRKHDRLAAGGEQVSVTIHNVIPWTHPETLKPSEVAWNKVMARRARKYADAVVVPTHAVAEQLAEFVDFGDRIRVIGGAASTLRLPEDADERAAALGLPERYVLAMGSADRRKALGALMEAMALPGVPELPLVIAGPHEHGEEVIADAAAAGLAPERIHALGLLGDDDLAVVYDRATVFVYPSLAEGFGLPLVEAFRFGTPVIHSDDPALLEVAGGAGFVVERQSGRSYAEELGTAIATVVDDESLCERLGILGRDRSKAFSWRDSAERVWQLHADL